MTGQVFVSYAREDSIRVDTLGQILSEAGIPVWRDTASLWPGEDWRVKIRAAIRGDALAFLACFSQRSVGRARSYQNEELVLAVEELRLRPPGQPWLIPVRFDDCQIPERELGGGRMLADLQPADLFGDRYKQNAARLVTAIDRIITPDQARVGATVLTGAGDPPGSSVTAGPGGAPAKYVVSLDGARGVQIGDGNVQHNSF